MPGRQQETRDRVLVLGDLIAELVVFVPSGSLRTTAPGLDITLVGSSGLHLVGSALLFAMSLQAASSYSACILGALGHDKLATLVKDELRDKGLSDELIRIDVSAPTPIMPTAIFDDGTRVMIRPPREILPTLSSQHVEAVLSRQDPASFKLVFISGYLIASSNRDAIRAVEVTCNWARSNAIPVVLDLVPHEFAEFIGDLERVNDLIGKPDGYVTELRTARGLGLCGSSASPSELGEELAEAAINLAQDSHFAVVQHQVEPGIYGQIYATPQGAAPLETYPFSPSDRKGLGDKLLIQTLTQHGHI